MSAYLSVKQLNWQIDNKHILRDISFSVNAGEVIGIIGPNGAGKTSLLHCLTRKITSFSGTVTVNNNNITALSIKSIAQQFAVVAQHHSALFDLTVFDVVHMGLTPHKSIFDRDTSQDLQAIEKALSKVGLSHLQMQPFNTLSGGEQQRVLIARALVQKADILILDEPTNHLDVYYQHQILSLISQLNLTVIMTVHDLNLAAQYCQRLLLLHHGSIKADGTINEVFNEKLLSQVFNLACKVSPETSNHFAHVNFQGTKKITKQSGISHE